MPCVSDERARFSLPSVWLLYGCLLLAAMSSAAAQSETIASQAGDDQRAERFAALALACVDKEFPNLIHHVMANADEVGRPSVLTPAFYGCFDWHSAVHGHWMLVRLMREYPEADYVEQARTKLAKNLTESALLAEAAYMAHPGRAGFERPYGHAWLLQLVAELDEWDDPQAQQWRQWLQPLERVSVARLRHWIPLLSYPIRGGEHSQTAFAFGLVLDYARRVGDAELEQLLVDAGERFYRADQACPLGYEPSGHDFLSPCLAEADFLRRLMEPEPFASWLRGFLPTIGEENWLPVGQVSDREDGKLAHIDGLNISRAWMLQGIASGLPADDSLRAALNASASQHAEVGLSGVSDEHYAGSHWLASFAVYLLTQRGIAENEG